MASLHKWLSAVLLFLGGLSPAGAIAQAALPSDQDISEAYIYLLGRLLVTRQMQLDFGKEGLKWNELTHRQPGAVDWPNPNLDVAYSEAWVAVDEASCTLVNVPKVEGRYFTVQFLNGWGETLANINERVFPKRAHGKFAVCLRGAKVDIPVDAVRIDLPARYSRVLSRVELRDDWDAAVALQKQFTLEATGTPKLPEIPQTVMFDLERLPGVEAFDSAQLALDSEPDANPGLERYAAIVRAIAQSIKDPAQRARTDQVIKTRALTDFGKAGHIIGHGKIENGWARPAVAGAYNTDFVTRSLVNYGGIWANILAEVVYYRASEDSTGAQLRGENEYVLTFTKDELPANFARYFWSVIAVDTVHFRVLPNPKGRYLINRQTKPELGQDGSLTLYLAAEKPLDAPDGNWLPTPKGAVYRLTFRYYGPTEGVANGTYWPPAVVKR